MSNTCKQENKCSQLTEKNQQSRKKVFPLESSFFKLKRKSCHFGRKENSGIVSSFQHLEMIVGDVHRVFFLGEIRRDAGLLLMGLSLGVLQQASVMRHDLVLGEVQVEL